MRILKDSSLSQHHKLVVHALMFIIRSLGLKSIQFLPQIMTSFLHVMRICESEFRTLLFQHLSQLVSKVKQHIRDYLREIFSLIREYWEISSNQVKNLFFNYFLFTNNLKVHIITLIEEISSALGDEFKPYVPGKKNFYLIKMIKNFYLKELLPRILHLLNNNESSSRESILKALHALKFFGMNLDDYLHLVIPIVVKLCEYSTLGINII